MPAMPIAESRPPIVVGIKQTSSATSTVSVTACAVPPAVAISLVANTLNGYSVTVTSRNTIVRPASRMSSAISFGVFLRFAPSTIAIMRSRKLSPGFTVTLTISQSDSTRRAAGHRAAITAALADHRRALARDRALVDRRDAFDDLAVAGNDLAGLDEHEVAGAELGRRLLGCLRASRFGFGEHVRGDVLARLAQGVGLRLATAFGHRLGEVREQHGEPQPHADRGDEPGDWRRRRR